MTGDTVTDRVLQSPLRKDEGKRMKKTMDIQFRSMDMVEKFAVEISNFKGEFDLISGRKVVDAKSFMGIFTLDLSRPLRLVAETDEEEAFELFRQYQV